MTFKTLLLQHRLRVDDLDEDVTWETCQRIDLLLELCYHQAGRPAWPSYCQIVAAIRAVVDAITSGKRSIAMEILRPFLVAIDQEVSKGVYDVITPSATRAMARLISRTCTLVGDRLRRVAKLAASRKFRTGVSVEQAVDDDLRQLCDICRKHLDLSQVDWSQC